MVNWYIGTQGFSYPDWEGLFYPAGMPERNYLAHYSRVFKAVEIDSSFYGKPRKSTIERWYAVTPENFKMCLKTPSRITHQKELVGAQTEMLEFLDILSPLRHKLGIVLIQMPPSFTAERYADLQAFLAELPKNIKYALEFRHRSWFQSKTAELLSELGVCWVTNEYPGLPEEIKLTADFLYLRWMGPRGRFDRYDRQRVDVTPKLIRWWEKLLPNLENVQSVYGFFNDDYAGHAPATCKQFISIADLPTKDDRPPQQGRLI